MKILFVIPAFVPAYGGPYFVVQALARELRSDGHEVAVHTSQLESIAGNRHKSVSAGADAGAFVRRLPTGYAYRWASVPLMWTQTLRTPILEFAPDIVHICGYRDGWGVCASLVAQGLGIPFVWEPMGMLRPVGRSGIKKRFFDTLVGHPRLSRASAIVVTSDVERGDSEAVFKTDAYVVRPNGLDLPGEEFTQATWRASRQKSRENLRKQVEFSDDDLLYLGRISERKGLQFVADALVLEGKGRRLVCVGPDEQDGTSAYLQSRLGSKAILVGAVTAEEKWSWLAAAGVCVLMSPYGENFGLTVGEAALVGTPSIVSPAVGCGPMMPSNLVTICERDPEKFIRCVQERTNQLGQGAEDELWISMQFVRDKFSWKAIAQEQLSIYRSVRSTAGCRVA